MNADWMIPVFVVIDDMLFDAGHKTDVRASVPDSEILLISIIAAKYGVLASFWRALKSRGHYAAESAGDWCVCSGRKPGC